MKKSEINTKFVVITYKQAEKGSGEQDTVHNRIDVTAPRTADAMDKPYLLPLPDGVRLAAYPAVDSPADGEGMQRLAAYTQRAEWRWRVRNDYAAAVALDESPELVEDITSVAALAIVEHYAADPAATEHSAYVAARRAVSAERTRLARRAEREWDDQWCMGNPALIARLAHEDAAAPLPAELVTAVSAAVDRAILTDVQAVALRDLMDGVTRDVTASRIGSTVTAVSRRRASALLAVLDELAADPAELARLLDMGGWMLTGANSAAAALLARDPAALKRAARAKAAARKAAAR